MKIEPDHYAPLSPNSSQISPARGRTILDTPPSNRYPSVTQLPARISTLHSPDDAKSESSQEHSSASISMVPPTSMVLQKSLFSVSPSIPGSPANPLSQITRSEYQAASEPPRASPELPVMTPPLRSAISRVGLEQSDVTNQDIDDSIHLCNAKNAKISKETTKDYRVIGADIEETKAIEKSANEIELVKGKTEEAKPNERTSELKEPRKTKTQMSEPDERKTLGKGNSLKKVGSVEEKAEGVRAAKSEPGQKEPERTKEQIAVVIEAKPTAKGVKSSKEKAMPLKFVKDSEAIKNDEVTTKPKALATKRKVQRNSLAPAQGGPIEKRPGSQPVDKYIERTDEQSSPCPRDCKSKNEATPKAKLYSETGNEDVITKSTRTVRFRKSMTPAFPSSGIKLKQVQSVYSRATPSKRSADLDVISHSDSECFPSIDPRSTLAVDDLASVSIPENYKNAPITPKKSPDDDDITFLRTVSKSGQRGSSNKPSVLKSKSNINGKKVQTKLNSTSRDVKLKGRAIDPPKLSKSKPQEELIVPPHHKPVLHLISDSDSDKMNAEAGPSVRRKLVTQDLKAASTPQIQPIPTLTSMMSEHSEKFPIANQKIIKADTQCSNPNPNVEKPGKKQQSSTASSTKNFMNKTPVSPTRQVETVIKDQSPVLAENITPQIPTESSSRNSTPRAPAQYMSKAVSASSESSSNTSESDSEYEDSLSSVPQSKTMNQKVGESQNKANTSEDIERVKADSIQISDSESSASFFQTRSARSQSVETNPSEHETDNQSQRERGQSIGSPLTGKSTSQASESAPVDVIVASGTQSPNRDELAQFAVHTDSRYPSMTELKNRKLMEGKMQSSRGTLTNPDLKMSNASSAHLSSSSDDDSSSDESSSSDDSISSAAIDSTEMRSHQVKGSKEKSSKGFQRILKVCLRPQSLLLSALNSWSS